MVGPAIEVERGKSRANAVAIEKALPEDRYAPAPVLSERFGNGTSSPLGRKSFLYLSALLATVDGNFCRDEARVYRPGLMEQSGQ